MKRLLRSTVLLTVLWSVPTPVEVKGDDFGAVVKIVEEFYGVKQRAFPFSRRLELRLQPSLHVSPADPKKGWPKRAV
ncbi:MAG: hypothetical protein LC775_20420 [Acidobacteria bacterium]|nr:hypothetical protein [Acidobacteriota bacterium]